MTCEARQKTTEAAEARLQVLERDGWRCVECQMMSAEHIRRFGRSLDVHRIKPGEFYSLENCVSLCRPCHNKKPRRRPGDVEKVAGKGQGMVTICIPEPLVAQFEALAKERFSTIAAQARQAILEFVERNRR